VKLSASFSREKQFKQGEDSMKKAVMVIAVFVSIFVATSCKDNRVAIKTEPARQWYETSDTIYFSVTSNGKTGEDWIEYLENRGFRMTEYTKRILRSKDFKPTFGVTTKVAVLKGAAFKDTPGAGTSVERIRNEAARALLTTPNAEIACLIRDKFTDSDMFRMGLLGIMVMHEPIHECITTQSDRCNGAWGGLLTAGAWRDAIGNRFNQLLWIDPNDHGQKFCAFETSPTDGSWSSSAHAFGYAFSTTFSVARVK
jgi:hypothetical protein